MTDCYRLWLMHHSHRGLVIVLSGVVAAYVIGVIVNRLPPEALDEVRYTVSHFLRKSFCMLRLVLSTACYGGNYKFPSGS